MSFLIRLAVTCSTNPCAVSRHSALLIVGFTSGRPALAKTNHLLIKDAEAIGFTIGALSRHDPAWASATSTYSWAGSPPAKSRRMCRIAYHWHKLPGLKLILERKVIGKAVLV